MINHLLHTKKQDIGVVKIFKNQKMFQKEQIKNTGLNVTNAIIVFTKHFVKLLDQEMDGAPIVPITIRSYVTTIHVNIVLLNVLFLMKNQNTGATKILHF